MTAPTILHTLIDVPRGLMEQALFAVSDFSRSFERDHGEQHGDGRPVILIPGLGADEWQMGAMRSILVKFGYDARTWGLGRNWGARTIGHDGEQLLDLVSEVCLETGRRVTLIGWSLGGLQARIAAYDDPTVVREVITLGSPFNGRTNATSIGGLFSLLTGEAITGADADAITVKLAAPVRVPTTSIYSLTDGVVASEGCVCPLGLTTHIVVPGAHTGLATNPEAMTAILLTMRGQTQ